MFIGTVPRKITLSLVFDASSFICNIIPAKNIVLAANKKLLLNSGLDTAESLCDRDMAYMVDVDDADAFGGGDNMSISDTDERKRVMDDSSSEGAQSYSFLS